MTDTSNSDHTIVDVKDPASIYELLNYAGNGGILSKLYGPEAEFFVCRVGEDNQLHPITSQDADALVAEVWNRCGMTLSREAIYDHVELDFQPLSLASFREDAWACQKLIQSLFYASEDLGMRIVPADHPPHIQQVDRKNGVGGILDNLDKRPRIQVLIGSGIDIFGEELVNFANGAAAIHISSSYDNPQELYDDLRRANYMAPIDYVVTSCCLPFNDGMQDRRGHNHRLEAINAFGATPNGRTGIDPLFYEAPDGETFLQRYVERVLYSPMLAYYPDTQSDEQPITSLGATQENPIRFIDLPEEMQTVSNFQLAASCFWYHTKIADLPIGDENGKPYKRLERRVNNTGTWQLPASSLVAALIGSDSNCAEEIDQLLEAFGYHRDGPANCPESGALLERAMKNAEKDGATKGLNFQFGYKPEQTAQAFEKQRIQILKRHAHKYEQEYGMQGLTELLDPLEYIAEHNRTDTMVLNELCQSAEDTTKLIAEYKTASLANPVKSLGMMLRDGELPELNNRRGRQPSCKTAPNITPE